MRVPYLVLFSICTPAIAACTHVAGPEMEIRKGICDSPRLPADDREARTAVHESGHAVASWLIGCAVIDRITIVEDDTDYGQTFFLLNVCTPHEDAVISLAGTAAKDLVFGPDPVNASGGSGDTRDALKNALEQVRLAGTHADDEKAETERLMERWRREAAELLRGHDCLVAVVAARIYVEKNVDGVELIPSLMLIDR